MKQMEVTIMGQSYILACPEGGEVSLLAAVAAVDSEMSAIRDAGKVKARERIAVLAALNLAYQLADQPAPTTHKQKSSAPSGEDAASVQTLIDRIDAVIGQDGHLL